MRFWPLGDFWFQDQLPHVWIRLVDGLYTVCKLDSLYEPVHVLYRTEEFIDAKNWIEKQVDTTRKD